MYPLTLSAYNHGSGDDGRTYVFRLFDNRSKRLPYYEHFSDSLYDSMNTVKYRLNFPLVGQYKMSIWRNKSIAPSTNNGWTMSYRLHPRANITLLQAIVCAMKADRIRKGRWWTNNLRHCERHRVPASRVEINHKLDMSIDVVIM